MSAQEANRIAESRGLDLVKIAPQGVPPVCKIMDYGKYKFDSSKKEKDARKHQKTSELKEVQLSMTIAQHDMETKAKHAIKFLTAGDKVKVTIRMRGRQMAHASMGVDVMNRFFAMMNGAGTREEKGIVTEGRNILMILSPIKK